MTNKGWLAGRPFLLRATIARTSLTAQKGKDLLFKVDSDGSGSFVTVGGLRARTLAFNAATVDITDQESPGQWRELLAGARTQGTHQGLGHLQGCGVGRDGAILCVRRHDAGVAGDRAGFRHGRRAIPDRDIGIRASMMAR